MEPLAWVAVGAGYFAIMALGARQLARARRRWVWVFLAPAGVVLLYMVWIAVRNWPDQPVLAIFLGLIGVPSLILFIRSARRQISDPLPSDPSWTLSSEQFDYIVWTAIGVPLVTVVLLLVMLVTGGFGTSR
jgi:hypothetical protein